MAYTNKVIKLLMGQVVSGIVAYCCGSSAACLGRQQITYNLM